MRQLENERANWMDELQKQQRKKDSYREQTKTLEGYFTTKLEEIRANFDQ